jgi:hypothetical protein
MIDITTASPETLAQIRSALHVPNNVDATFTNSVSAPTLSGTFYGDGTNLTGVSLLSTQAYILSGNDILPVLGDNVVSNQYTDVAGGQGNTAYLPWQY